MGSDPGGLVATPPLRARDADAIAIATPAGRYSVGEIHRAARAVARTLQMARRTEARLRQASLPCILLPTSNAAAFLSGLIGSHLAGFCSVPWRDKLTPAGAISDVVCADAILHPGGDLESRNIEILDGPDLHAGGRTGDLIVMTSGSTGQPKGVALSLESVILNATSAGASMGVWRAGAWVIDIDLALMSALSHTLMAWQHDLPLVQLEGKPLAAIPDIAANGFGFGGAPMQLLRLHEKLPDGMAPRMVASSGDFLQPEMIKSIIQRLPATEVHKLYGLTELGGRFCHMPHALLMADMTAAGIPLAGFSARLANTGDDGIGEIQARTPLMMHGYYRTGGGFSPRTGDWFATGDLGRIDDAGVVTVTGRVNDVFKVGGEKVDRHTIESALAPVLGAREYCVLAVEHPLLGQCAALFIGQGEGAPPRWADIVGHLRQTLPTRFIPGLVYRLDALPRLGNGKIDRVQMAREHAGYPRLG